MEDGFSAPLRDYAFAQVGDYHGFLDRSLPGGFAPSGRHPSLVRGIRSLEWSYMRDPDYGDEAYRLSDDPFETDNLLNRSRKTPPGEQAEQVSRMRGQLDRWEDECLELRERIGVIPGARGFDPGWE